MTEPSDVTLIKNAIHNPSEPRHFMRLVPAKGRHQATMAGHQLADSTDATLCKEVGYDIYDTVVYFPRSGVDMALLERTDKSTHCPLKGDTEYFDAVIDGQRHSDVAWSYVEMVAGDELKELIAFDTSQVEIT